MVFWTLLLCFFVNLRCRYGSLKVGEVLKLDLKVSLDPSPMLRRSRWCLRRLGAIGSVAICVVNALSVDARTTDVGLLTHDVAGVFGAAE
jgi:hypothetical protein